MLNERLQYSLLVSLRATSFLHLFSKREEIEKQKSKERYNKLHSEGKTEQARADLARLAIIKKQREDAAKKREELRKGEETVEILEVTDPGWICDLVSKSTGRGTNEEFAL